MAYKSSLYVVIIAVTLWASVTAQEPTGPTLADQAEQNKALVLQVLAKRSASLLPEHAEAVADVLDVANQQLDACTAALEVHQQVWQLKVCGSAVLQQGLGALNALQAASGASAANVYF